MRHSGYNPRMMTGKKRRLLPLALSSSSTSLPPSQGRLLHVSRPRRSQ